MPEYKKENLLCLLSFFFPPLLSSLLLYSLNSLLFHLLLYFNPPFIHPINMPANRNTKQAAHERKHIGQAVSRYHAPVFKIDSNGDATSAFKLQKSFHVPLSFNLTGFRAAIEREITSDSVEYSRFGGVVVGTESICMAGRSKVMMITVAGLLICDRAVDPKMVHVQNEKHDVLTRVDAVMNKFLIKV